MIIKTTSAEKEKISVAMKSMIAAIFLTFFKFVVAIFTGSLGILSEAVHSAVDLIAAGITLLAVKFSARPADKTHNYGHGKIENISALIETFLLLVISFWIISTAVEKIFSGSYNFINSFWGFAIIIISIVVDFSRSRALSQVAEKHQSQALEADALHFSTDMWSSGSVLVGLIFSMYGFPLADAFAAIVVALIVIAMSYKLGKRAIDDLLDHAPDGVEDEIFKIAEEVNGILKVTNLRARKGWPNIFIDVTIEIPRTFPFETANAIAHEFETAIHKKYPTAEVMIHPEPVETPDEVLEDKINLIASRYNYNPHDIQIYKAQGKFHIEMSIEFDKKLKFDKVHSLVDNFEKEILSTYLEIKTVVVHIEESRSKAIGSNDVKATSQRIVNEILKFLKSKKSVSNCEVIMAFKIKGKYHFSIRCNVNKNFSLEKVHSISTELERNILVKFPKCASINFHTEPK